MNMWKVLLLLSSLMMCTSIKVQAATNATPVIQSARNYNCRQVSSAKYQLWSQPPDTNENNEAKPLTKTKKLKHKLVQLDKVAVVNGTKYFEISRRGHNYGWLNK
ncbi:GW dipeptide domain-containing protein [Lactobacillus sp. ESL0677]|uniref:GW dipeptide domain-containing protein n=1 Tax=Lactobacillus sp. ESL0677 TaxID=2983208 RepID=UPI0023F7F52F|nr:GW dipeptide domain-containing protein [Lactobacillus sp. ESL0677]WEV37234.1 GW dipeptide domain-containing protein [Lactobacillus sp. ESL0677]